MRHDRSGGARGDWALRAALGRYRQFVSQFDASTYNVNAVVPTVRFWLPVTSSFEPPEAYHVTGAVLYMPAPAWEIGMEGYYKAQPLLQVIDYGRLAGDVTAGIPAYTVDSLLTRAEGVAYGMGLLLKRTTRKTHLVAQYEYGVAKRRVANRFDGRWTPAPWHIPHQVLLSLHYSPIAHLTASAQWQGLFGRVWGFRQAYYDYLEPNPATATVSAYDFSEPETHRLPAVSQLDVGLAYAQPVGPVELRVRAHVANLLNRRNVVDRSLRYDEERGAYVRLDRPLMPFLPSLSVRLTW